MLYTFILSLQIILCPSYLLVAADPIENNCSDCDDAALYLTPFIQEGRIKEAKKLAEVHHDSLHVPSYSGFFNVDQRFNSQMFFWYFPSQNNSSAPLVLWLEGGPGLPILLPIFHGNGPFQLVNDTITKRNTSWNNDYHLLFIDNPVGTGYSHTNDGYSSNQTAIAANLYSALNQFLQMFSELRDNELYVVGESYGAKCAVQLCDKIHSENQNSTQRVNLQGFALFSGYFDPINQYSYATNLYNMGLLDKRGYNKFIELENAIKDVIINEKWSLDSEEYNWAVIVKKYMGFSSYYNIIRPDEDLGDLFTNISIVDKHMNPLRKALHVGSIPMEGEMWEISIRMLEDLLKTVAPVLSSILNHYRGVVVSGQLDIIVSYPALNNALNKLNFSSSEEWLTAKRNQWYIEEELAGYYKTAGNLTEVMVLNSGHFIPADQPERAYDIIHKLTSDSWE